MAGAREAVLRALAELDRALSIRELARFAEVAPSTALRVVDTLVAEGVVARRASGPRAIVEVLPASRRSLRRTHGPQPATDAHQLELLRDVDAEVSVVDAKTLKALGVRRPVPTFVVTTARWADTLSIPVPVVVLRHGHGLRRLELADLDVLIGLLAFDPLAAAEVYTAVARKPDPGGGRRRRLLRRLHEEKLEKAAAAAGIPLDRRQRRKSGKA